MGNTSNAIKKATRKTWRPFYALGNSRAGNGFKRETGAQMAALPVFAPVVPRYIPRFTYACQCLALYAVVKDRTDLPMKKAARNMSLAAFVLTEACRSHIHHASH